MTRTTYAMTCDTQWAYAVVSHSVVFHMTLKCLTAHRRIQYVLFPRRP